MTETDSQMALSEREFTGREKDGQNSVEEIIMQAYGVQRELKMIRSIILHRSRLCIDRCDVIVNVRSVEFRGFQSHHSHGGTFQP